MCSLIVSATVAIGAAQDSRDDLFTLLIEDGDESVRWALVLFLAEYGLDLCDSQTRFQLFQRLAEDPHFWVRREVAIALARQSCGVSWSDAIPLLARMREREMIAGGSCSDEVLHFVEGALRRPRH